VCVGVCVCVCVCENIQCVYTITINEYICFINLNILFECSI
jgi:hypothetical protein